MTTKITNNNNKETKILRRKKNTWILLENEKNAVETEGDDDANSNKSLQQSPGA